MDLSFTRFERDARAAPLPSPILVILATAAGRQAATPTARLAARLAIGPVHRARGSFERETAHMLMSGRPE